MKMRHLTLFIAIIFLLSGCGSRTSKKSDQQKVTVSIVPLKYFVDRIGGDDFEVNVMVPPGASPETFEPTTNQMRMLADSKAFFTLGLMDFEQAYEPSIRENNPNIFIANLSDNVEVDSDGECSCCSHGTDPHIWLSPKNVRIMAEDIYAQLAELNPDSSDKYRINYENFKSSIDSLDSYISKNVHRGAFLIYHPSLKYFANDYGLTQIAIENEGKEPTPAHLKGLIDIAKQKKIGVILYQEQLSKSAVASLSKELNIEMKPFDPLAYDWVQNMNKIVLLLQQATHEQ